ncbi:MAG: BACON domain-containing protein [Candidatus Hydrogenedentes bacterium]|nr:BACON domain-containing protein [Candidatus Hydrogenedentota bacterium]
MGPRTPLPRRLTPGFYVAARLLPAILAAAAFHAYAQPSFDFGDGRHGSFTAPPGETTVQDLWSQVRGGSDPAAYNPSAADQVPNLENLTISSGGVLTVSPYSGNAGSAVDPSLGGVLRLKVRGTLTIEAGASISATGKGYRGGTMEGGAPGLIGQQGDSWGNAGTISTNANRGGGGGGFGEINNGNNPGAGGGGGHREAGARGTTGQGSQTGGLGGQSFDSAASAFGQGFRDTYPFPRFGSGGGRGGQVANFANVAAFGGNGGGVIIIEAARIINNGAIEADGAPGGSNLSGGGGGAGGSILIQSLSESNGAVTVAGGAGGVGTVLGNDGGAGGRGILLWDTRYKLDTSVTGQGSISLSPSGGLYTANAIVELTAVPEDGWRFDRWEGDADSTLNPELLEMDSNKSVRAVFVELPTLSVTPLVRDIGPSGGNLSFNVSVSGSAGAIDWTAAVDTGADFITINMGSVGVNDDVITISVAPNPLEEARTGTLLVSSPDVSGEPVTLTVNQGPATPVLSVTPSDPIVPAVGEELVIRVSNVGTGSFDWNAFMLTGQGFASITSGGMGTNDGTFVVTVAPNPSALQRTATLSVTAPGALNAPATVTITQQAGAPLLQVTPSSQLIGSAAGTASLTVTNGGTGSMNWTAAVVEGASFATITGGSSGTDAGLITVTFQTNTAMENRTARLRVESVDAANSPVEVTITQTAQEAVLLVSPETQSVGSSAGMASFQVQNAGTGTMNWTASVTSGANFASITGGTSGSNDGAITVSVSENSSMEDRTATIRVVAPGAANSPQTVMLVQTSRTPVLRVVPLEQSVGSAGGAINITIENGGTGTLSWTASLETGADFLSITSDSNGTNDGAIQVTVAPNPRASNRTGTVRLEAPGAADSPRTATIVQLGCETLDTPENLSASDGVFDDRVELIWSAVPNTMMYEVFRAPLLEPDRRELIGTSEAPRFSDTLAKAPSYVLVNRGCFNPGEFIVTNIIYHYEVRAVNACGASGFSNRTTGYRGLPIRGNGGSTPSIPEDVLPVEKRDEGHVIGLETSIALRLTATDAIDPGSAWAQIGGEPVAAEALAWRATDGADGYDGWIVVAGEVLPPKGGAFVVDAGASTVSGEPVAASARFYRAGAPEKGAGNAPLSVEPFVFGDAEAGQFLAGRGDVYQVLPSELYPDPVLVQIPVPSGVAAGDVALYYFASDERGSGWYPADRVIGWLAAPVTVTEDGAYIEILIHHGGIVRAGLAPGVPVPVAGAVFPADYGTLLVFVAALAAMAGLGRRRAARSRG